MAIEIYTGAESENMYGCPPCPKCSSSFRVPYWRAKAPNLLVLRVECDDCGHQEWAHSQIVLTIPPARP